MRFHDTITIGEFGHFRLQADYTYRLNVPYSDKHAPPSPDHIEVEKVEVHLQHVRMTNNVKVWEMEKILRLLEIPSWLWVALTDPSTLAELNISQPQDEEHAGERTDT